MKVHRGRLEDEMSDVMTGADMVVEALKDQGVEYVVRLSRRRRAADL